MRNIVLTLSYDGTAYHGWQYQPDLITIEQVVRESLKKILNHTVKIYAGARTDSGVHAFGQVINFHTEREISLASLKKGLNSVLPDDVRVNEVKEADSSFHARYDAKSKVYIYIIVNASHHSPFLFRYSWHIPYTINNSLMDETIHSIMGEHDFSSFKKKDEEYQNHVRRVLRAGVKKRGDFIYTIIEATGFLRYMVRNIVGTLVWVGTGRITKEDFNKILESHDRINAGLTAPAKRLFLRRIRY